MDYRRIFKKLLSKEPKNFHLFCNEICCSINPYAISTYNPCYYKQKCYTTLLGKGKGKKILNKQKWKLTWKSIWENLCKALALGRFVRSKTSWAHIEASFILKRDLVRNQRSFKSRGQRFRRKLSKGVAKCKSGRSEKN